MVTAACLSSQPHLPWSEVSAVRLPFLGLSASRGPGRWLLPGVCAVILPLEPPPKPSLLSHLLSQGQGLSPGLTMVMAEQGASKWLTPPLLLPG